MIKLDPHTNRSPSCDSHACHMHAHCFVPAHAKFAHEFLTLFHRPCAVAPQPYAETYRFNVLVARIRPRTGYFRFTSHVLLAALPPYTYS